MPSQTGLRPYLLSMTWTPIGASLLLFLASCGSGSTAPSDPATNHPLLPSFSDGVPAGNPAGQCGLPSDALPAPSVPADRVVGTGTPSSCTADAFIAAVAHGGRIVFDCGPDTATIVLDRPAKVFNDSLPDIVVDGGARVTLSGGGTTRILYMNTCDQAQHWTTSHCQDQETPRLTVQNLSFTDGNSQGEPATDNLDGGGAIWARGGRLKIVNCRFFRNQCAKTGPDVGGAAIRVFSQSGQLPVQVVNSTFGGPGGLGNIGSNGGALSSISVNWSIWNSLFQDNIATGNGGNPADTGTPGGGSGGAIYNDGNTLSLSVCGSVLTGNQVNAFGSAIFFVADDHDGTMSIQDSRISGNLGGSWYLRPGISAFTDTKLSVVNSTLEP